MITKLLIRNFKKFDSVEFDLGSRVVLIGPNNSGKTTLLQALALWNTGLSKWNQKRGGKETPEKRPAVTVSRRDLIAMPVPSAKLLWRDLHVRKLERAEGKLESTASIRIEILVEGITDSKAWKCGLEFDYANEESLYCRPLRINNDDKDLRMPVPQIAGIQNIAFLPPMSGLAGTEPRWESGRINVLIERGANRTSFKKPLL